MSQIQKAKRKSILHVQNIFLTNSIDVYCVKETEKYTICYEPKRHRYHSLVIKLDKKLISNINKFVVHEISVKEPVDINIKEDFRLKAKETDVEYLNGIRTIMRIVPSRYTSIYNPLYGVILKTLWRHTGMGGLTTIELSIPECPVITNSTTISNICYRLISVQRSGGGTHGLHTYLILAPKRGQFKIGEHVKISNINKSGHQHMYTSPVVINL
jgi:hypothetical protein